MATQYTAGLSAGQVLTAANMNSIGAASVAYTPAWTSTAGTPAIGNGTLQGRYFQINKIIIAQISWTAGSTTTYGTAGGVYRMSLPVTALNTTYLAGYAAYGDASTFNTYNMTTQFVSTTTVQGIMNVLGINGGWGQANPVAMATGDTCQFVVIYEAA
jgi:hypothetical protein